MRLPDKLVSRVAELRKSGMKIFLDYDGTLVPIKMDPDDCYADQDLKRVLSSLSSVYDTYIITGRSLEDITRFVGKDYNLIALHGAVTMIDGEVRYQVQDIDRYINECDCIFSRREQYELRYPGLRIYNKNGNVLFHMGYMDDPGQKSELEKEVERLAAGPGMDVYHGKMIVELRIPGVNKGLAVKKIRGDSLAMIAGDDVTDEEAFAENPDSLKIRVGEGETRADFVLPDYRYMRELLKLL